MKMKRIHSFVTNVFLLLVLVGLLIAMEIPSPSSAQVLESTESQLFNIARAAVLARNQILVGGDLKAVLHRDPLSPGYQDAMQPHLENALRKRAKLAEHQISYTDYRTELTVEHLKIDAIKAEMEAIEYTVFTLAVAHGDPSAPKTTEYQLVHTFVFSLHKHGWVLEEDKIFDGLIPARPDEATTLIPVPPLALNEFGDARPDKQDGGSSAYLMATINRQAIVDYAYEYWGPTDADYNPAYRNFNNSGNQGGDCTNFISQALRAGGWTDVPGWYRSTSAWWYNWLNQTWTWINAHYWWQFAWHRPRVDNAIYLSQLTLGDIMQIDFNRDGYMDHSMIITAKDNAGNIYLTYHTTNTKDRPFWDSYNDHPNAWYYGWILRNNIP
jgi:hypothetical protein